MSTFQTTMKNPAGNEIPLIMPGPDWHTVAKVSGPNANIYMYYIADMTDIIKEFEPTITLVAHHDAASFLIDLGFTNIIDIDDYSAGDKWTLSNGSYVELTNRTAQQANFKYYLSDGTQHTYNGINADMAISTNQISCIFPYYPPELAESLNNHIRKTLEDGGFGTSSLLNYEYNTPFASFGTYVPSAVTPGVNVSEYYLANTRRFVITPTTVPQSTKYHGIESFASFYDGVNFSDDPFADNPDGPASSGGGDGGYDTGSDSEDHPGLPSVSAVDTGFITIYNPSLSELKALARYMWSSSFDLDTFKKLFADPMDAILGLSFIPLVIPNGGSKSVVIGNIDTGVTMTLAADQWLTRDCGSVHIGFRAKNSYLDYSPYTKAYIYLPCIGVHAIDIDDIIDKDCSVSYNVDILSGSCLATIKCDDTVKYHFTGHCSAQIPFTGASYNNAVAGALSIAGQIGQMVATGGMSTPIQLAGIASTAVTTLKPDIEKSGSISTTSGILDNGKPGIILSTPHFASGESQNKYLGYPSFEMIQLKEISGFTVVDNLRFNYTRATLEEYSEIIGLLKSGVIL